MRSIHTTLLTVALTLFAWSPGFAEDFEYSNSEIDRMIAPIALYPDIVLSHILIATTYPFELIEADRWVKKKGSFGGQAAVDGVSHYDWDPSVKALVAFPDLLDRMVDDLEWLQDMGELFLSSKDRVLARVQALRQRAYSEGSLEDVQHLQVVRETKTIYLEPIEDRVVYLPYYDPVFTFGREHWHHHAPVAWRPFGRHNAIPRIHWGPRNVLSTGYYFAAIAWPRGSIVLINNDARPANYLARTIVRHPHTKPWSYNPLHRRDIGHRHSKRHQNSDSTQYERKKEFNHRHYRRSEHAHRRDRHAPEMQKPQREDPFSLPPQQTVPSRIDIPPTLTPNDVHFQNNPSKRQHNNRSHERQRKSLNRQNRFERRSSDSNRSLQPQEKDRRSSLRRAAE